MTHMTGPDQRPDQRRSTWSALPLLTLTLKSSSEGRNAFARHRNRGWPPADPNAGAFAQANADWIQWHTEQLDMPAW